MAYNGYLIATTGADLNGTKFPLFFPCYAGEFANWLSTEFVYLLAVMYVFIPPSTLSAHILSATLVYIGIAFLGLLAAQISRSKLIGVIVGLTAMITPWLFELSRLVQETSVLILAVILFLVFLYRAYRRGDWNLSDNILLSLSLAMITYAYAGGRVLGPPFAFGLLIFATDRRRLVAVIKTWAFYAILLVPTIIVYFTRNDVVTKRFREVTYFDWNESLWTNISSFVSAFFHDISPAFLLLHGDPILRHHIVGNGEIFVATFLLSIAGLIIVIRHYRRDAWWRFVLYGLIVSVLPGAITLHRYHTLRLLALPVFLLILAVPALQWLLRVDNAERAWLFKRIALVAVLVLTLMQGIIFQKSFREIGPLRILDFNTLYPMVLDKALALPSRPIYLKDGYYGPEYIHGLWYGTLKGIDLKTFVHLSSEEPPPPGALVISAERKCTRCSVIFQSNDLTLYTAWNAGAKSVDGAKIVLPVVIGKEEGVDPGQFSRPTNIHADKDGSFYVADSKNSRIEKLDSNGDFVSAFGAKGSGVGEIDNPSGVATDDSGNIYVTDAGNHKLMRFGPDGTFIKEWCGGNLAFYGPRDIAVGPDKMVYFLDAGRFRIGKFDPESEAFQFWGERGSADGELAAPTGLAIAGDLLIVADVGNKRIQLYDLDGNLVRQWHIPAWDEQPPRIADVAFDDQAKVLYVSNEPNKDILAFDLEGNPQQGIKLDGEDQFIMPSATSLLDAGGRRFLLVIDTELSQVFKFEISETDQKKPR